MHCYQLWVERLTGECEKVSMTTFTFISPGELFRIGMDVYKVVTITGEKIMEDER